MADTVEVKVAEPSPAVGATVELPAGYKDWTLADRQDFHFNGKLPKTKDAAAPAKEAGNETESAPGTGEERTPEQVARSKRDKEKNNREWRESQAEIKRLRGEVEALKHGTRAAVTPAESAPAAVSTKPKLSDYTSQSDKYKTYEDAVDAYTEAATDWKLADKERRQAEESAAQTKAERETAWKTAITEQEEAHEDFADLVYSDDLPLSHVLIEALKGRGKEGAAVLYFLGQHPKEAKRIADLTVNPKIAALAKSDPAHAAYLYGKLETVAEREIDALAAKLKSPESPKPKTSTDAPSPSRGVSGKSTADGDPADAALKRGDLVTWNKLMNERKLKRLESR